MPSSALHFLFISYSRADLRSVEAFLNPLGEELRLQNVPVQLWRDVERLQPGVSWRQAIEDALAESVGILVFVSQSGMLSVTVREELRAMLRLKDRLIIPVILEHVTNLPPELMERQWLDLSNALADPIHLRAEAAKLASTLARIVPSFRDKPPLTERMAAKFSEQAASTFRKVAVQAATESPKPVSSSVFVVHGHDSAGLDMVCEALKAFGVEPIVLSRQVGQSQSLLQKFLQVSERANFAIVLISSDDYGASLLQYDTPRVGKQALKFRARQNVILELGFFYGSLGWENVFVLQRKPPRVFPDFEHPSDLAGAVFDEIDEEGLWKSTLADKLDAAGFSITFPKRV